MKRSHQIKSNLRQRIREMVAKTLADMIVEHPAVLDLPIDGPEEDVGPLGGHKSEFMTVVKFDGGAYPVLVCVYSDERIDELWEDRHQVDADARERLLRLTTEKEGNSDAN